MQDKRKRDMLQQVERVEHYVEQALFYARSENVEKDLRIQYCDLYDCCSEALLQCKYLCTSAFLQIHFAFTSAIVATDEKWVIFILNQLIENAVKYRKEQAHLYLYITQDASYVTYMCRIMELVFLCMIKHEYLKKDLREKMEEGIINMRLVLVYTYANDCVDAAANRNNGAF